MIQSKIAQIVRIISKFLALFLSILLQNADIQIHLFVIVNRNVSDLNGQTQSHLRIILISVKKHI